MPVISATLGRGDRHYQVQPATHGFRATNPQQNLAAQFTPDGLTILSGGVRVRMQLSGYGYAGRLESVPAATPWATANRLEFRRGPLTEWYVNSPLGLEQGFTLNAPPKKPVVGARHVVPQLHANQPLQIILALSAGNTRVSTGQDGKSLSFARGDARPALRYSGLMARDATGRELPAWMELQGSRLILAVEDSGARYPVVVDPTIYSQTAILTVPGGAANNDFGTHVFVDSSGDTAVSVNGGLGSVNAFVFVKTSGTWSFATQLTVPSGGATSAAVSGDGKTIVVGNCFDAVCVGSAFVYLQPAGGWNLSPTLNSTATLTPSNPLAGARYGIAVAIDQVGDTIAVGAPCEITALNPSSPICGEVHVFVRPSGGWVNATTETAILSEAFSLTTNQTQCPGAKSYFSEVRTLGVSVSMDSAGDAIVAGAKDDFGCSSNTPGAAYVFVKPSSGPWATTTAANATLLASSGVSGDDMGISASTSGDGSTAVAGAPQFGNFTATKGKGAGYVFLRPPTGWSGTLNEAAKLTTSDGMNGDAFADSVSTSLDGSTVVAGTLKAAADGNLPVDYVFLKAAGWSGPRTTEDQKVVPAAGTDINGNTVTPVGVGVGSFPDAFLSLSSDATTIASGDPPAQVGSNTSQGAVFVFTLPPCTTPTITPPLSPATAMAGGMGFSLTVNGTNFASGAAVTFNGAAETTAFVSATQVTAAITAADIAAPGMVNVTVTNPGGCVSTAATFTITAPPPMITSITPSSTTEGGPSFSLGVTGSNFVSGDTVNFNGKAETTTFMSATQLSASIPATDIATAMVVNVTVTDPSGAISSPVSFTINNPAPTVSGFTPAHVDAGKAFVLTINGTNFVTSSSLTFNGKSETTTFVSSTQLTAMIPATDAMKGGSETVSVTNPTPGGGTATAATSFTLDGFAVSGPSGAVTVKRGDKATITITITPTTNGFASPITFSVSGEPAKTMATFNPTSFTPGTTTMTTTLTIQTTKPSTVPPRSPSEPPFLPREVLLALESAALLLALHALRGDLDRRRCAACLSLALVLLLAAANSGCAPSGGTPTGNSTLAISATSGTDVETTNVMLTVQ